MILYFHWLINRALLNDSFCHLKLSDDTPPRVTERCIWTLRFKSLPKVCIAMNMPGVLDVNYTADGRQLGLPVFVYNYSYIIFSYVKLIRM